MNYNQVDIKKVKFGKVQKFKRKTIFSLIPIFYKNTEDLIIKSPRLYVPNSIKQFSGRKLLDLILYDNDDTNSVSEFITLFELLEAKIKKQIKYDSSKYNSIIGFDEYHRANKMKIVIENDIEICGLRGEEIPSNFPVPTFGYFVLHIKNIWKRDTCWGINIHCEGCMILPSQISSRPIIKKLKYIFEDKIEIDIIGNSDEYSKYFKMKKMGVPTVAIKHKMLMSGLNSNIIDMDENTPIKMVNSINDKSVPKITANSLLSVVLKKVNPSDIIIPIKPVKHDIRVPSLDQIQDARKKLKGAIIIRR
jgi:hypothetical protein